MSFSKKYLLFLLIILLLYTPIFTQETEEKEEKEEEEEAQKDVCEDQTKKGENCTQDCNTNCLNQKCYITGKCFECKQGYYGEECENSCPEHAVNCTREGEITECENGYYLKDKQCVKCGEGCVDGNCDFNTGHCTCKLGFFMETCEGVCNRCLNCSQIGGECYECETGYYGQNCTQNCIDLCYENKCDLEGNCIDKTKCAKDYLFGEKCNRTCNYCGTCDTEGKCLTCNTSYYYGDKCEKSCKDMCFEDKCYMNGTCIDKEKCANPYQYGEMCEKSCKDRCKNDQCQKSSGECTLGCADKYFNTPFCDLLCPDNCLNKICSDNGTCTGCINKSLFGQFCNISVNTKEETKNCSQADQYGTECYKCENNKYYGKKCENECNEGCGFKNCSIDGRCSPCDKKHYGSMCESRCDGCGEAGCDDQANCKEFECVNGTYGLKCDKYCECKNNSKSNKCGKFSGTCLNCNFGYFGTKCDQACNYKCKTGLCCLANEDELEKNFEIESHYSNLDVVINGIKYNIEIDYNYGYPLTLFKSETYVKDCDYYTNNSFVPDTNVSNLTIFTYNFTNYETTGELYKGHYEVAFSSNNNKLKTDLLVATDIRCKNYNTSKGKKIDGIIGLGFFNNLGETLYNSTSIKQNLLTYSLSGDNIKLLFGGLDYYQKKYISKLTSCNVILDNNTDIQEKKMTCKLSGIKTDKYKDAINLDDSYITFSINEESHFVLKNGEDVKNYLQNEYFEDKEYYEFDGNYFYYEKTKINKLDSLGFVFNNYYYSYSPDLFFVNEYKGEKKKFLIKFDENAEKSEFVLGKKFLEDVKFTINNEEAVIYFYTKRAEYFNGDFKKSINKGTSFKLKYSAGAIAGLCLGIIIFINLATFAVYYFLKKRRMNNNIEYMKIE